MRNADELIAGIEAMIYRGAFLNALYALDAIESRIDEMGCKDIHELKKHILDDAKRMANANPSWSIVGTACHYVTLPLQADFSEADGCDEPLGQIRKRIKIFRLELNQAQDRVAVTGANIVPDGGRVGVMSYSGTLINIFKKAWQDGKRFSILGTESRPNREGLSMAAELASLGIPYTLIADVAQVHHLDQVDLAFVGVDTLVANGDIINKIGTMPIALGCRYHGKPLYAATSILKMNIGSLLGEPVSLKVVDNPLSVVTEEILQYETVNVSNVFFEVTPAQFFTGLITEYGLRSPGEAHGLWDRTWAGLTRRANEDI